MNDVLHLTTEPSLEQETMYREFFETASEIGENR